MPKIISGRNRNGKKEKKQYLKKSGKDYSISGTWEGRKTQSPSTCFSRKDDSAFVFFISVESGLPGRGKGEKEKEGNPVSQFFSGASTVSGGRGIWTVTRPEYDSPYSSSCTVARIRLLVNSYVGEGRISCPFLDKTWGKRIQTLCGIQRGLH